MALALAVVLALVALVVAGAAVAAGAALDRIPVSRLSELAEGDGPRARRLAVVARNRGVARATLALLAVTGFVTAAALAAVAGDRLADAGGAVVATLLVVVVAFAFGVVVPATLAVRPGEARAAAVVSAAGTRLLAPVRSVARLLLGLSAAVLRRQGLEGGPFDLRPAGGPAASEEDEEEEELLHSVSEFGETLVHSVMTPRTDMTVLPCSGRVDEALDVLLEEGYSRAPCYADSVDHIQGLVILKDLVRASRAGEGQTPVQELMRPAVFVPEQKRVAELLSEMRTRRFHMAIVVDEYGGTAGLVTIEDLLEELVGEIVDEFDADEQLVEPLDDRTVRVAGWMPVADVNELLGVDFPDTEWDTVGGFVLHLVGRVPEVGESRVYDGVRLVVDRVQGRRVEAVRIILPRGGDEPDSGTGAPPTAAPTPESARRAG